MMEMGHMNAMTDFKIEKNVPITGGHNGTVKWPFVYMEVGDSVFFPGSKMQGRETQAAHALGKKHGRKFVCRTVDGGIRIWRAA
jgi:peptidoglycan/xylan/chitin deacetylase (PgdA/CDA1 family)